MPGDQKSCEGSPGAQQYGATVAVLLCTYNGERYLCDQLDSIAGQQGVNPALYISDDGSVDTTLALVEAFRARNETLPVSLMSGPRRGYVANYLSLLATRIEADYFAFADQDDEWDEDKLARAVEALSAVEQDRPALYCSRTRYVDGSGNQLGLSPLFRRRPSFANALVQNIAGGNTMVMNRKARELLCAFGPVDVVSHDWWAYLVVTACGGQVLYDPVPSLSYRQHGDNLIGSSAGWADRFDRFFLGLRGRKREWNDRNIAALRQSEALLAPACRSALAQFCEARQAGLFARLKGMRRSGIYAQTVPGNIGLFVAVLLNIL